MRKILVFCLILCLSTVLLSAAGTRETPKATQDAFIERAPEDYRGKITLWSFTDEPEWYIRKFNEVYPNVEVEFTHTPGGPEYIARVNAAVTAGNQPDVFSAEISWILQWIESDRIWANISAPPFNADELTKNMIPYVRELGKDSRGNQRALSLQATPGGFFYRRSLAKEFFGTDDPDAVSALWPDIDSFMKVAAQVRDQSGNKVHLFSSWWDIRWFFFNARTKPWVVDNRLVIDDVIEDYITLAKYIRDQNLSANAEPGTPSWTTLMQEGSVIGYVYPTWGMPFGIIPRVEPNITNPKDYTGNWAVTDGPAPFFWGGTWWGISANSKNPELSWLFLRFLTLNQDFLHTVARERGELVSDLRVIDEVTEGFSTPFLGGQNSYAFFRDAAMGINPSLVTRYDQQIEAMFRSSVSLYIDGELTRNQAIENFRDSVANAYPDIVVR
jgi:ABC-type glycerol-3-phosphate transport system substrate-binding protein